MKLVIVSHTPHHLSRGVPVGWGPTVREIDHLASLFDEVVHVAPLHPGPAPASALPYRSDRVTLRTVAPSGGSGLKAKAGAVRACLSYGSVVRREMRGAALLHVRAPAGIALAALAVYTTARRRPPLWAKYAGDWRRAGDEPVTYALQRRLLRGLSGSLVTVNATGPLPDHVRPVANPSLDGPELARAATAARAKHLEDPLQLLFVGRVEKAKGADLLPDIVHELRGRGLKVRLDVAGDGPLRGPLSAVAGVAVHGWLPHPALERLYRSAHILLLPSVSEGWPKVASEAMAYGVVPIVTAVSVIPEVLARTAAGVAVEQRSSPAFAAAVAELVARPSRWAEMSAAGTLAAARFTYDSYVGSIRRLVREVLGLELPEGCGSPASRQPVEEAAP